jgi:CRISPR-associated protein Cas1
MSVKNETIQTTVSLDDIDIVIIENQQTTITASLISHMAKANISVIFVDDTFIPSAICTGMYKNSRTTKIQRAQISIKKPKHNRLWRDIIYAKVLNQADVLNYAKSDEHLYYQLKKINSADKNNVEAVSAAYYFKGLFGREFSRNGFGDSRNIALNYGYSIMRSSIARHIVAYGLNPSFGVWHSSELNAFNLADDLIEPFRPIVDRYVYDNIQETSDLTTEHKQALVGLLYVEVSDDKEHRILVNEAIRKMVASYQSFCLGKREDISLFTLL